MRVRDKWTPEAAADRLTQEDCASALADVLAALFVSPAPTGDLPDPDKPWSPDVLGELRGVLDLYSLVPTPEGRLE